MCDGIECGSNVTIIKYLVHPTLISTTTGNWIRLVLERQRPVWLEWMLSR